MIKEILLVLVAIILIAALVIIGISYPSGRSKKRNDIYGTKRGCHNSVDFVVTWVDSSDPSWQKRKNKRRNIPNTDDSRRFGDGAITNIEIETAVRSILRCAPWCRYIWIVTDRQTPLFIDELTKWESLKVRIVDHTEFIPADEIPTFNSHTIEKYLHNIPGLSEKFIYGNDDFAFTSSVKPEHFFKNDKPIWRPILIANFKKMPFLRPFFRLFYKDSVQFLECSSNLGHHCGPLIWRYDHHFVALTRQMFTSKDVGMIYTGPFRSKRDVPPVHLATVLGHSNDMGYIHRETIEHNYYSKFMESFDTKINLDEYHEICVNSQDDLNKVMKYRSKVLRYQHVKSMRVV